MIVQQFDWRRCALHRVAAEIRFHARELGRSLHVLLDGDRIEIVDAGVLEPAQQEQSIGRFDERASTEHIIESLVLAIAEDVRS